MFSFESLKILDRLDRLEYEVDGGSERLTEHSDATVRELRLYDDRLEAQASATVLLIEQLGEVKTEVRQFQKTEQHHYNVAIEQLLRQKNKIDELEKQLNTHITHADNVLDRHENELDGNANRLTEHTNATLSELDSFEEALNHILRRLEKLESKKLVKPKKKTK